MRYVTLHLHTNLWYAEYTHDEVIRRFPYVYRQILETLERYPEIKVSWDFETSISIPYLQAVAPDVLDKIKKGIQEKRFEILLDTWSFSLVSMHTKEEFEYQYRKAVDVLEKTFGSLSKGFFAQETAYAETLPKLLSSHGIKFLPIKKETIEMLGSGCFQSNFLTAYTLRGYDNSTIIAVPFESVYSNLATFVEDKRNSVQDESLILILGDTEIFSPRELKRLGEYLEKNKKELKTVLISEYVNAHPPVGEIYLPDCTWAIGTNDYFLWCRDPWDQKLWTLNEKARRMFYLTKFWLAKLPLDERQKWEKKLNDGLDLILLGQNSDKFGWNPCPEKRKEGEIEFLSAFYHLEALNAIISEKIFQSNPEKFGMNESYIKHYLLVSPYHTNDIFHHLPIPLTVPVKFEKPILSPDIVSVYHENNKIPFSLQNVEFEENNHIKTGEISIVMQNAFFKKGAFTHLFIRREKPMINTSNLGEFLAEIRIKENRVEALNNKSDNFKVQGDILGYDLLVNADLNLISRNSSTERSTPSDLYRTFKIFDNYSDADVLTEFKIYRDVPFVEIVRKFIFKKETIGQVNPITVSIPDSGFKEVIREIHDTSIRRDLQGIEEATPLINDWCVIKTSNAKLFIAADSTVHSIKEISIADNQLIVSPMETIYESNPYEHFRGEYIFKVLFGVFSSSTPDNLLINTARIYSRPVYVIDMIQSEGVRSV